MSESAISNSIDSSQICLPVLVLLRTTSVWAAQHCSVRLLFLKLSCFVLTTILAQFTLKINTKLLEIFKISLWITEHKFIREEFTNIFAAFSVFQVKSFKILIHTDYTFSAKFYKITKNLCRNPLNRHLVSCCPTELACRSTDRKPELN